MTTPEQPTPAPSTARAGLTGAMATFRVPFFGIYWANSIFEFLAFGIQQTAKQWLITDLTASRTVLGLVGFIMGVIGLVVSPFAGVLSDRMSKRNLLVITRVFFLIILAVEGILVLTGAIRVWHVLVASVALGIFQAVQNPPSQTYVYDIVGKDRMQHAVALSAGGAGVSQMVGPVLGGALIGVSGVAGAYGVAGIALGIGAVVMLMIPIMGNPTGGGSGKSAMHDLKEGFVYIAKDKPLMLVMIACSMALFNGAFGAMRPIFARHVLEVDAVAFGIMSTANGVGSIVGAVMVALVLPPIRRPGIGITIAMLAYATTMFLYSFAFNFTYILVIEFASGFVGQMWQVNTISGLQRVVPEHMRGRIISVIWMVVSTASIGNLFVGILADAVGDQLALGIFGIIPMLVLTLELIFFWKPLMSMKANA